MFLSLLLPFFPFFFPFFITIPSVILHKPYPHAHFFFPTDPCFFFLLNLSSFLYLSSLNSSPFLLPVVNWLQSCINWFCDFGSVPCRSVCHAITSKTNKQIWRTHKQTHLQGHTSSAHTCARTQVHILVLLVFFSKLTVLSLRFPCNS